MNEKKIFFSAGVRLAMAETRLVKETRDFLIKHDILVDENEMNKKPKRSDTKILVKNLQPGSNEEILRKMFAKFGDLKEVSLAPGKI